MPEVNRPNETDDASSARRPFVEPVIESTVDLVREGERDAPIMPFAGGGSGGTD
jgi:hypothetical protein